MSSAKVAAFGRAVRRHREEQGLSYYDVANRGGSRGAGALSPSYVRLVESLDRPEHLHLSMSTPSLSCAFQFAKALGLPLSKLVEGIDHEVAS